MNVFGVSGSKYAKVSTPGLNEFVKIQISGNKKETAVARATVKSSTGEIHVFEMSFFMVSPYP